MINPKADAFCDFGTNAIHVIVTKTYGFWEYQKFSNFWILSRYQILKPENLLIFLGLVAVKLA